MKKIFVFLMLTAANLFGDGSVYVLCYHTFMGKAGIDTDHAISDFSNQINKMESLGYKFVSFNDMLSNRIRGRKNILITVDDGHNTLTNAFKSVFRPRHIKPVLFIYPGLTGHVFYSVTFDHLKQFQSEGALIGGHGYNHLYINKKLLDTDPESFNREVFTSRKYLMKKLGSPIDVFAHPFGVYDKTSKEALLKSGYKWAFTIKYGVVKVPLKLNKDSMELPRYMVARSTWPLIYDILKKGDIGAKRP